jgi:ribonuclease HI
LIQNIPAKLYTDGSCAVHTSNLGGWSFIFSHAKHYVEDLGFVQNTTSNRMELTAVLQGLSLAGCLAQEIQVFSDSAYVVNGCNLYLQNWINNGWKTSLGNEVKNRDLWELILHTKTLCNFKLFKVKGHSGDELNERCDVLCKEAIAGFNKPSDFNILNGTKQRELLF